MKARLKTLIREELHEAVRRQEEETLMVLLERCIATAGRRAAKQVVDIALLKQILVDKGFVGETDGAATAKCTPELKNAIRKFQELHWEAHPYSCRGGCDLCDGIVGTETEANLLDSALEPSPACEQDRTSNLGVYERTDLKDMIAAAARRHGLPSYIALAMAQAESGTKALRPTGSGDGQTFYPMGIQLNRGRFVANRVLHLGLADAEIIELLLNPASQIELAAIELARGWKRHRNDPFGNPDEAIRVFWAVPLAAKRRAKGNPDWVKTWSGSYSWATRLKRWRAVLRNYKPQKRFKALIREELYKLLLEQQSDKTGEEEAIQAWMKLGYTRQQAQDEIAARLDRSDDVKALAQAAADANMDPSVRHKDAWAAAQNKMLDFAVGSIKNAWELTGGPFLRVVRYALEDQAQGRVPWESRISRDQFKKDIEIVAAELALLALTGGLGKLLKLGSKARADRAIARSSAEFERAKKIQDATNSAKVERGLGDGLISEKELTDWILNQPAVQMALPDAKKKMKQWAVGATGLGAGEELLIKKTGGRIQ